jgi:hypothetical protein
VLRTPFTVVLLPEDSSPSHFSAQTQGSKGFMGLWGLLQPCPTNPERFKGGGGNGVLWVILFEHFPDKR